jgi:hypothetical protein
MVTSPKLICHLCQQLKIGKVAHDSKISPKGQWLHSFGDFDWKDDIPPSSTLAGRSCCACLFIGTNIILKPNISMECQASLLAGLINERLWGSGVWVMTANLWGLHWVCLIHDVTVRVGG